MQRCVKVTSVSFLLLGFWLLQVAKLHQQKKTERKCNDLMIHISIQIPNEWLEQIFFQLTCLILNLKNLLHIGPSQL